MLAKSGATFALVAAALAWSAGASSLAAASSPAARGPSPTPSPSSSQNSDLTRTTLRLNTLDPKVVRPHDTVTISGVVTNTSSDPLNNVSVSLRASSDRIATRYDLGHDSDPATQVGVLVTGTRQTIGTLEAGASATWQIAVPEQRLGLPTGADDFGAYPIAVEVRTTSGRTTLAGRLPTTLMWMPDNAHFTRTDISWLVPLVDGVHRGAGDVFVDDTLARDLAPSGRLGRLVSAAAAARLPLTYLVDPALVDDAAAMAGPSTSTPNGAPGTTPKPGSAGTTPKPGSAGTTTQPGAAGTTPNSSSPASQPSTPAAATSAHPTASAHPSASAKASASGRPTEQPYRVTAGSGTKAGTGGVAAADWLHSLRGAVASSGSVVVGLPYGDADLTALAHAGLDKEIAIARSTGQSDLATTLDASTLRDVAWPVSGLLDRSTLDDLSSDLVDTVVLSDQALPPRDPNDITGVRTDLQTASGTVRAVLTDSQVSQLLSEPTSTPGGVRATEQRFLAETMLVTEQRPGSGSSLVVAPPRLWDPSNGLASTLLADTASVPWLRAVTVGQIAAQPPDDVPRSGLVYPAAAQHAELPQSVLAEIPQLRAQLASFSAILGAGANEPFINDASVAILRAESSSLRRDPRRSTAILSAVGSDLAAETAKVFISDPRLITLTSRKQKIPITVVNQLPDPVTVQLRLSAVNAARLKVTPIAPFTVPGKGGRQELLVEVEATTSGRFEVQAQLMTPDVNPAMFGAPVSFQLNSTAYGAVALAIAGGAAGVLFLVSAIRITRRVRRRRRDAPPADGAGGPGPDGPEPGPQTPADATVGS